MDSVSLGIAILMGFTGSLHCAGMCGPIVWVMPFQHLSGIKKFAGIFLYHFGRITTYALLALVLFSFRSLFNPQVQQYISIALGAVLLIIGVLYFIPAAAVKVSMPWADKVKNLLGKFVGRPGLTALLVSGFLNGLLPCGLVYMALSTSLAAKTPVAAMGLMYAFGLGTVPMMVSITLLRSRVNLSQMQLLKRSVPILMFAFGSIFILRGLNLGIPYLSPKIEMQETGVKANCCHKQ